MANITSPRDPRAVRGTDNFHLPMAASLKLIRGCMVGRNASGYVVKMETGVACTALGECLQTVDNSSGAAGDKYVDVRAGVFNLHILGADTIVLADIDQFPPVYAFDDQTVAKTSNSGARPIMGRLLGIEGGMAQVQVGPSSSLALPDGDLVAANNLSDVASAATARANLGANKGEISQLLPSLVAGVFYIALPDRAVTITKIKAVINGALTGANLVITPAINTTNITSGAVTVTQAASAAGDQAESTPSAANVSDGADELLRLTLSGNTAAVTGSVTVEYTW
jgi:hypothetical protein